MRVVPAVRALAILGLLAACSGNTFQAGGSSGGNSGSGGSGGGAGKGAGGSSAGKGGAASGGSASGSGGASGAAGSGACVSGNACGPEGSTCTEDSCCPCLYTCRGGVWEISACPGCAAPSCPGEPPSDGAPCGGCIDPVGLDCSWDDCDLGGVRYSGICDGSSWSVVAEPCSGSGCCESDSECEPLMCVNTICKEPMAEGCWRDEDCGPDSLCSGVAVCPCNADCGSHDTAGTCVPANIGCCRDDTACPVGGRCDAGVCRVLSEPDKCWSNRDCSGSVCQGAELCVCGQTCTGIETPGTCG